MDQNFWMAIKAYTPAALLIVVSIAITGLAESFTGSAELAPIATALGWASAISLIAAAGWIAYMTVRLWRAEHGLGLLCSCSGLLGREIDGRYGPYRRCLRCSRNVPRREYEMLE